MIQPSMIEKLKTYNSPLSLVLSVYLGNDTVQAPSVEYLLTQFHSLLHGILTKEERVIFENDIKHIEEYLSDYVPSARSLVFFSAGQKLWEIVSLEFPLPMSLSVNSYPNIKPLVQSLQKYSKYLVLLVDREKARMFTVEQGEIVDYSNFTGYVPQKIKATGRDGVISQSDTNFRHNEVLLKRHIDRAVQAVVAFTEANDIHFVILGGHSEIFKKVAKSLPKDLRVKIAGSFVTEVNLPLNEILRESKKIASTIG